MKIAAILARHRRLLALCVVSLLLHVLVIEWIAARANPGTSGIAAPPAPLAVRLHQPQSAPGQPAAPPAAPPAPVHDPVATRSVRAAAPISPAPASAAPAVAPPASSGAALASGTLVQMPERYRVRMPPAAHLTYAASRSAPGQPTAAAGSGEIVWQADGNSYQLRIDGVLGRLSSQGGSGDAGILPLEATEQDADGALATTRFDQAADRIVFSTGTRSYPIHMGSQDRASLLMQLAGIGLAEPDQVRDVIEVFVAGAQDAGIVKFQVTGQEDVESALGTVPSWHLAQVVRPGEPRLELWLAPQHSWYPVQLRVTAPDGTVSTQVITRIETL